MDEVEHRRQAAVAHGAKYARADQAGFDAMADHQQRQAVAQPLDDGAGADAPHRRFADHDFGQARRGVARVGPPDDDFRRHGAPHGRGRRAQFDFAADESHLAGLPVGRARSRLVGRNMVLAVGQQVAAGVGQEQEPVPDAARYDVRGTALDGRGLSSSPRLPAIDAEDVVQRPAVSPAFDFQHRPRQELFGVADAEHGDGAGACGHAEQLRQLVGFEERHPAEADAFGARQQPHVLDGAGDRGEVHVGHGAAAEDVALAAVAQGDHQHLGAVEDAFDLELEEVLAALAERLGGDLPFGVDEGVDARAQVAVADVQEAPGLHVADGGRQARGSIRRSSRPSGSGSGRKWRTSRRSSMARRTAAMSSSR